MPGRLPTLEGTDVVSAKRWFAQVVGIIGGEGWHADDDVSDIMKGSTGSLLFDEEESDYVNQAMSDLFDASSSWPDPGLIYSLAAQGKFDVETIWPGFDLDVVPSGSLRTNLESMEDHPLPNILIEDGEVFIVEFPQTTGKASDMTGFQISHLAGASYDELGFDTKDAVIDRSTSARLGDLSEIDDFIIGFHQAWKLGGQ